MPAYNWRDRNAYTPPPARLFDAVTGEEVPKVFYYETETGHVGRFQVGADGCVLMQGSKVLETWEFRELRIEWTKGEPLKLADGETFFGMKVVEVETLKSEGDEWKWKFGPPLV